MSLQELQKVLMKNPFSMTCSNEILLFARFLIENNQENTPVLDLDKYIFLIKKKGNRKYKL